MIRNNGPESEALIKKIVEQQKKYWGELGRLAIHFNRKEFHEWLKKCGELHHLKELTVLKETAETISINLAHFKHWLELLGNGGDDCIYDLKTPLDQVSPDEFVDCSCYEAESSFEVGTVYSARYRNFLKEILGHIEAMT